MNFSAQGIRTINLSIILESEICTLHIAQGELVVSHQNFNHDTVK